MSKPLDPPKNHRYGARYRVEPWNRVAPPGSERLRPGLRMNSDEWGYADAVFLVSVVTSPQGASLVPMALEPGGKLDLPSREMLMAVRMLCDHWLEDHCVGDKVVLDCEDRPHQHGPDRADSPPAPDGPLA